MSGLRSFEKRVFALLSWVFKSLAALGKLLNVLRKTCKKKLPSRMSISDISETRVLPVLAGCGYQEAKQLTRLLVALQFCLSDFKRVGGHVCQGIQVPL